MAKVYLFKGNSAKINRNNYTIVGYLVEEGDEEELVVDVLKNPSEEPLFDLVKKVLEDPKLPEEITIYSDNNYVVRSLSSYWKGWEENGWITVRGEPVRDKAIIQEVLAQGQPLAYRYISLNSPSFLEVKNLLTEEGEKKLAEIRQQNPRKLTVRFRD
jgi:ribonuclease HI